MFAPTSRYAGLPTATFAQPRPDGTTREVTYVRRRLLPRLDEHAPLVEHVVQPGERLDHLAARYTGDPTQFWRIADANDALEPAKLEEPGRRLTIALPDGR